MKYLQQFLKGFLKDERGVTPVVGVILMVAVTVVMGAVIAGFVYGYVGSTEQGPLLGLAVEDDPATEHTSFLIKHTGGESMVAGDWKLSVTINADSATKFAFASAIDGDVITETPADLSAGTTLTVTKQTIVDGAGIALAEATYHIVIIHEGSNSLLMDTNVRVR